MRLRLSLTYALLAASLGACGSPTKKEDDELVVIDQLTPDEAFAQRYFLDDLDCMRSDGATEIDSVNAYVFQGDKTKAVSMPFDGTSSVGSLKSDIIKSSSFGFQQTQNCEKVGSDLRCSGSAKVVSAEKSIKICKPGEVYPRASVEGVALTSLAHIMTAYRYYASLPGHSDKMQATRLLVLPTVEKVYKEGGETKRQLMTDNLAYTPAFSGEPTFVVFPMAKRAQGDTLWQGLNLWELPWGLAHEFGHHVFRTHTGVVKFGGLRGLDLKSDEAKGSDTIMSESLRPIKAASGLGAFALTGTQRVVTSESVWNAVNEGFADLYAHYVFGSRSGIVANVDCFEVNRDVTEAKFANGTPKALSRSILASFFDKTVQPTPACSTPSFQDEHALGAALAYGIDQLFQTAAGTGSSGTVGKARLLLKWAEAIGPLALGSEADRLGFDDLIKPAVALVARNGVLSPTQCADVREYFPEYAESWLRSDFSCR